MDCYFQLQARKYQQKQIESKIEDKNNLKTKCMKYTCSRRQSNWFVAFHSFPSSWSCIMSCRWTIHYACNANIHNRYFQLQTKGTNKLYKTDLCRKTTKSKIYRIWENNNSSIWKLQHWKVIKWYMLPEGDRVGGNIFWTTCERFELAPLTYWFSLFSSAGTDKYFKTILCRETTERQKWKNKTRILLHFIRSQPALEVIRFALLHFIIILLRNLALPATEESILASITQVSLHIRKCIFYALVVF